MPLILKVQDAKILQFLVDLPDFVIFFHDFPAFFQVAVATKWLEGLKVVLQAPLLQAYFHSLPLALKVEILEGLYRRITTLEDKQVRTKMIHQIVEELLTRRPFVSPLVLGLTQIEEAKQGPEGKRVAAQCLRNLTGEDFVQMFWSGGDKVEALENNFSNVVGDSFENHMAKISQRYKNEGKQDAWVEPVEEIPQPERRVRFGDENEERKEDHIEPEPPVDLDQVVEEKKEEAEEDKKEEQEAPAVQEDGKEEAPAVVEGGEDGAKEGEDR